MTVSTLNRSYDAFNLYDRDIDDEEFFALCQRNPNFKLEKNPDGTVIIMPNTGGNTGKRNTKLTARLSFWEEENGGNTFDSSTAFIFPNGATRSPDAAWVSDELWNTLTDEEKDKFPRLTPEFVIELMSPSDKLRDAKQKMLEYIENGVQLAWLINPSEEEAHIFRADGTISKLNGFNNVLSGEDVLKGFVFDLSLLR